MRETSAPLESIDCNSALFHDLPVGVLILDENRQVRTANPMAELLLGVKAADIPDRPTLRAALDTVYRSSSPASANEIDRVPGADRDCYHKAVEVTLARPDGTSVWLNLRTRPIPGGFLVTLDCAGPRIHNSAALEAHTRLVEQAHSLDLENLLRASLHEIEKLTFSAASACFFVDEKQTGIVLQVASSRMDAHAPLGDRPQAPRSIEAASLSPDLLRRQRATIRNAARAPKGQPGNGNELVVPVVRDGKVRAVVVARNKPSDYDDADVRVVEWLANLSWKLASLKLAQREVERRANLIAGMATSAPGLMCQIRLSPQGRITLHQLAPGAEDFFGISASELATDVSGFQALVHPDDIERQRAAIAASARDLTPYHNRSRFYHPSKGLRWLEAWSIPQREADGGTLWHGFLMDVTAQAEVEAAAARSAARVEESFNQAAIGMLLTTPDFKVMKANQAFCTMLGYSQEELAAIDILTLTHPEDRNATLGARDNLSQGCSCGLEKRYLHKDGHVIWAQVNHTAVHADDGSLSHIFTQALDITERKRAQAALHENEERFRLLIEHAPAALALFDNDMCYLAASRRWVADYAIGHQDLRGRSHYEIFPDLPVRLKSVHRRALAGEALRADEDRFERQDGRVQWLRWEVLPWRRADGSIGGIVIFSEDITARKTAELESQASRAKLDAAMRSTTDAVCISDAAGNLIDFNEAFATFNKFASKQECSRFLAEYPQFLEVCTLSGAPVPVDEWAVPRALRGETVTNAELGLRRKDTGETWFGSFSFAPIRNESGVIVGSIVAGRDITDQKRAERALTEVSERLRQISEAAREWIWEIDADGLYTYSSPAVEELLGYRPQDLVGQRHFFDLWPSEVRETMLPEARVAMARKEPFRNSPNTCLHKDGHRVLMETTGFPILGPDGTLLGYRGAARDITERESAQTALKESEARFRDLFEQLPIAVWEEDLSEVAVLFSELRAQGVSDLDHYLDEHPEQVLDLARRVRIVAANAASLKLLGAASATEITHDLSKYFTDASFAVFRQYVVNLFNGNTKFEAETSQRDTHGNVLDLHLRMSVLPGHTHDLGRVLASFTDLTARKAAEADRRELERQVNHLQRLESLGRLASGVSHDMNNVLGAIMAIGSLLQAKHKHDPDIYKDADSLLRAAVRGRDLVQGLRDFSRKELQSARRLDLNEIIRHEAELLERTSFKRISIVFDLAPNLPLVFGEASAIQNAIINLFVNALDAIPDKGTLTLSTRYLGQGFVELAVADDGQGMPPEVLARALEPFFTTKPIGQGTGLGLSQVYGTVKAHGGSLDIKSKPGEGTKVSMVFPAAQVLDEGEHPADQAVGPRLRVLKILVVDDEGMIRGTVLSLLRVLGHDAHAASSGLEALRRLKAGMEVDLVLLDINMPGMDGVETLARLRVAHPKIKVVLATGYADDRIPSILRRFPDIRILKKPFNVAELNRSLSDAP